MGRTPYIVLEQGTDPVTTRNALLHEIGHELEPFLIRTPDRALAFLKAFSKNGKNVPSWLDPRTNPKGLGGVFPLTPKWDGTKIGTDQYGLPLTPGKSMDLSPVEYYANLVSGQLGTPKYGPNLTQQLYESLLKHNVTPAASVNPQTYQRLINQGLIPKPFKSNLGNDIQLGS